MKRDGKLDVQLIDAFPALRLCVVEHVGARNRGAVHPQLLFFGLTPIAENDLG
jgi:hypothetical protein